MKFQNSSLHGSKVTEGTKNVKYAHKDRAEGQVKSILPVQLVGGITTATCMCKLCTTQTHQCNIQQYMYFMAVKMSIFR